jgi:LuxR family transcriptional activator of bioluminescence operon
MRVLGLRRQNRREMAQIVGVSERTVNFHPTSVIKKLGASNRRHAVAKAVMYGLVKPRP